MKMRMRVFGLVLMVAAVMGLSGCDSFERTTFNSLSASQAVINQAQTDYEARSIPRTACAFALINDAKAAQTAAVNGMVIYEQEKAAGTNLSAQTVTVTAELATIPALLVQIKALSTSPASCTTAP